MDNIADVNADAGRFQEALAAQGKSHGLLRQLRGDGQLETVCGLHRTARLEALCDRFDDAVLHSDLAIEHSHQLGKGGRVRVRRFANEVAFALLGKQQAARAVSIARDSLEQAGEVAADDAGTRARFTSDLAVCLQEAGELDAAQAQFLAAREASPDLPSERIDPLLQ